MNSLESVKLLLAATGGDAVKLFDISGEPQNPCVLTHSPSPGSRVNSVKWNHNNLVLASAGDDGEISLWRKNGQSLWTVPAKTARAETSEPSESISTISFSNKGSRYLCSGGSGQIVKIWDLQNKRCVKWLKGHTDTITGVMYNCKDEHIASVSRKGDIILHNLASGTRAAELRDPNGQVLGALDYSRMSRHLLVTAGDDGSIHLWDTTVRSPKVSWLKQHSAPTSGVSFSPTNDKMIASVGLDMKLYTFDTGSKKPSSCIPYEAPFSSLAFTDDGLTLAAGTSNGQVVFYDVRGKPQPITVLRAYGKSEAVTNLCWQRSKPVMVNENSCMDENVLLAGDVGDSILMPDPLPSRSSSSGLSMPTAVSGSRNTLRSSYSGDLFSSSVSSTASLSSTLNFSTSEETPLRSSLLTGRPLRLHASSRTFKDEMEVFSPLVEVQPMTASIDKFWEKDDGSKKELDRKPSFLLNSRRFGFSDKGANDSLPISDWKSGSAAKQDDTHSTLSPLTSNLAPSARTDDPSSITPPESWGGERFSDKYMPPHQSINMPSRFAKFASSTSSGLMSSGLQESLTANQTTTGLSSGSSLIAISKETSSQDTSLASSDAVLTPLGIKSNLDTLGAALPRRFYSYAERIGTTQALSDITSLAIGSSPKSKKTGAETREELLSSLLSRSENQSVAGISAAATNNGRAAQLEKTSSQSDPQQGSSFTLQLFQRSLEETLGSFQKSIHEDMRNLHIEILRQFHLQEMETSSVMKQILENQAEIMKELRSLRKETQQIRQLL
ncbi:protein NEDD1 [Andrographis paniculata]|uniref:protein NEDD1 n=1 Tax=Andrographis paniculata TaxID=175694 RepID=UPI0021E99E9E|nr:protein NEDD1 [Andrographis paniculata]